MPPTEEFLVDIRAVYLRSVEEVDSEPDGSSPARGFTIGKTTVDLLKPFWDLLDALEDIPFLSNLIQREIVYRLLRAPHGERLRAIGTLGDQFCGDPPAMRGRLIYHNSGLFDYRGQLRGESDPRTLATCRAQHLFPIWPETSLNAQTALVAKQKAPALFSNGAWNKSPLSQFS